MRVFAPIPDTHVAWYLTRKLHPFYFRLQLHDGADWVNIPVITYHITDTARNPVTGLTFQVKTLALSEAQEDLLTLERRVKCTHYVEGEDLSFLARIKTVPRTIQTATHKIYDITAYGESYDATRFRFLDSYPKTGITTWSEIIQDAWERYGPSGITFAGLEANTDEPDFIISPLGTLYEFMEEIVQKTGWIWKVVNSDLKFFDPSTKVSDIEITNSGIRPGSLIDEGMLEIANVVFVPAVFESEDFNDEQVAIDGQAQYFLQYPPRKGYGAVEEYFKPQIFVDAVEIAPSDIALDGSFEAGAAKVVYSLENRFIRFAAGEIPVAGKAILIIYDVSVPVIVRRTDQDSITYFDGEIHHVIRRSPRPTREEAKEIADAYLDLHAFPVASLTADMLEKRIQPGWYYQVTLPDHNINQLMPVVSVERWWEERSYKVQATFQKAPVDDRELIFDLFRRLERLESSQTRQEEIIARYDEISDTWNWTDEILEPGWSNVDRPSDTDGLKHHRRYIFEETGRLTYPD